MWRKNVAWVSFHSLTCHLTKYEQNKKVFHDVVKTNLFFLECKYESVYMSRYRVKHVISYTIAFSYESYRHIVYIKEIAHVTFADKGQKCNEQKNISYHHKIKASKCSWWDFQKSGTSLINWFFFHIKNEQDTWDTKGMKRCQYLSHLIGRVENKEFDKKIIFGKIYGMWQQRLLR